MAKLIRKTQKVFGQDGATDQFAVFGTMKKVASEETPDYSKDIEVIQSNAAYSQGWQEAVIANYAPFMEELNSICYSLTYQMSYLLQNGVPEWDDGTTYYINSIVVGSNSLLYRCLTDNCLNVDPTTDDGTNWYNYSLYGANQDLSNLTTAGIDKLHALKGYLDSGKLLSDPQLFEAVYSYNHSTFDLSKFTKVNNPIITDDGVASGFSTSDYLSIDTSNIDLSTANTWEIDFAVKLNNATTTTQMYFDTYEVGISSTLRLDYYNPSSQNAFRMLLVATDNSRIFDYVTIKNNIVNDTWYKFKLIYTGTHYIIKDANGNELKNVESSKKVELTSRILLGKRQANDQILTNGSIDLKQFSITVNGTPIFIGTKTGIDTIKPDNYTEEGVGLTITDEGIVSGFTNSGARLQASIDFTNMNTFSIEGKFYHSGVSNGGRNQFIFDLFDTTLNTNRLYLYNQSAGSANVLWNYPASDSTMAGIQDWFSYTRNAWQTFKFDYDGTNIKLYINGTLRKTSNSVDKTWLQSNYTLLIGNSNLSNNYNSNYTGQIDLNSFKIYVNGDLIYQPCLLIPYTESSTGSKIVDVVYRDRVIDVYQQYGSANYYTIDEVNQNATLPMGEIYGFIEQKASTDFDNVTQTAKNTSISWGMPDWSRMVSKTPYTEYTATERGWINASVSTDQNEFGLKINGNIVARALATGSSDAGSFACLVPVDVGDVYALYHEGTRVSLNEFINFIPCKGEA